MTLSQTPLNATHHAVSAGDVVDEIHGGGKRGCVLFARKLEHLRRAARQLVRVERHERTNWKPALHPAKLRDAALRDGLKAVLPINQLAVRVELDVVAIVLPLSARHAPH